MVLRSLGYRGLSLSLSSSISLYHSLSLSLSHPLYYARALPNISLALTPLIRSCRGTICVLYFRSRPQVLFLSRRRAVHTSLCPSLYPILFSHSYLRRSVFSMGFRIYFHCCAVTLFIVPVWSIFPFCLFCPL